MDLQCESISIPAAPPENSQINNSKWIMPLLLSTSKLNSCKQLKYSQGVWHCGAQHYRVFTLIAKCPRVLLCTLKFKMQILNSV